MGSKSHLLVLSGVLLFSSATEARVIYGEDNRVEVISATPAQQKLASSTAVMMLSRNLLPKNSKYSEVSQKETLGSYISDMTSQGLKACKGERFIDQPNPAQCSGFLIAPDLIVTAGHCVTDSADCSDNNWVFDFKTDTRGKAGKKIKNSDIYKCQRVISQTLNSSINLDYAIVQLDRPVLDREPLEINSSGEIRNFTRLMVIGAPMGLPTKVADGAWVRSNHHPHFFQANLDSFQGNSGSAVFNEKTGLVEGILVRGEQDFVVDYGKSCIKSVKCTNDNCRGEDVMRLTVIPEVSLQNVLNEAALRGDVSTLNKVLKLETWVDFYTKDGQTALMKAALGGHAEALSLLLAAGAEVNLQDAEGNSALHHLAKSLSNKTRASLEILLGMGAGLELKNKKGETPLDVARANGNLDGVEILKAKIATR